MRVTGGVSGQHRVEVMHELLHRDFRIIFVGAVGLICPDLTVLMKVP